MKTPLTISAICVLISCSLCAAQDKQGGQGEQGKFDKTFWALTAANAAVTALDGYQTAHNYREDESAWLYGTHPGQHPVQLGLTMAGEFGLTTIMSRYLRHHQAHSRIAKVLWAVPVTVSIGAHGQGIAYNFRHEREGKR